ncbi:MAG: ion transporter [Myxococcales bacterium]|nr:ion transporter [Myxococcales bacterium]
MESRPSLDRRLYELFEAGRLRGWAAFVQGSLLLLIVVNVVAVVLETVESIGHPHARFFERLEFVSAGLFLLEYLARLHSATASPRKEYQHPLWGRLRFALSPMALVDLVAILPPFLLLAFGLNLGALRILRVLRVLKLMRYSPAMATLGRVIYNERKALVGTIIVFAVVLLLSSSVMYYAERGAQPVAFGSIPAAMWWAMSALTTVGYGDVTPTTPLGRIMASVITLAGIGVLALPTGIIASSFMEEAKRRDFTVTWSLLADVPFFQGLKAPRIGDLVRVVRPSFVTAGDVIMRKGERGRSMYVIASGEVEVLLGEGRAPIVLGHGDFFGELALLERVTRTATVRARSDCRLLELESDDLHELMHRHPELEAAVREIAAARIGAAT